MIHCGVKQVVGDSAEAGQGGANNVRERFSGEEKTEVSEDDRFESRAP